MKSKLFLAVAAIGLMFGGFASVPSASALACSFPTARATIQTTVPYGGSAGINDLYTVKAINTGAACGPATITITPRVGMGFGSIVSTNGGWSCAPLASGDTAPTICTNPSVAGSSSSTIRVQYNKLSTVSGTATAVLN